MASYRSMEWRDGKLILLDQRFLPREVRYVECTVYRHVVDAIRRMVVRGAPAIGAAAAYGMALAAREYRGASTEGLKRYLAAAAEELKDARPTAVNLSWAVGRVMARAAEVGASGPEELGQQVLEEAHRIALEDVQTNQRIALNGALLVPDGAKILHHCNTGSLATVDYGTALGIVRKAHEEGKRVYVFVDETRPRLQGARLTAWELLQLGIPHTVVVDGASGYLMRTVGIDLCLVGCDRVARNGDTANKIGTYNLAVMARAHGVPFYVAAPTSTIDLTLSSGDGIVIEERDASEVAYAGGERVVPEGSPVANPAFDVTPAEYITAFVTEAGIAYPPFDESLPRMVEEASRWRSTLWVDPAAHG